MITINSQGVQSEESISFVSRRQEIVDNLGILREVLTALQAQQDLYERQAHQVNKIGSLFQTLTQLDFQDPDEATSSSSSSNNGEHLGGGSNHLQFSMIRAKSTSE